MSAELAPRAWPSAELTIGNGSEWPDVQQDYVVLRLAKKDRTNERPNRAGLFMPDMTGMKDPATGKPYQEYRRIVVAIGEGPITDILGPDGKLVVRPTRIKVGDEVLVIGGANQAILDGEMVEIRQIYQCVWIVRPGVPLPEEATPPVEVAAPAEEGEQPGVERMRKLGLVPG